MYTNNTYWQLRIKHCPLIRKDLHKSLAIEFQAMFSVCLFYWGEGCHFARSEDQVSPEIHPLFTHYKFHNKLLGLSEPISICQRVKSSWLKTMLFIDMEKMILDRVASDRNSPEPWDCGQGSDNSRSSNWTTTNTAREYKMAQTQLKISSYSNTANSKTVRISWVKSWEFLIIIFFIYLLAAKLLGYLFSSFPIGMEAKNNGHFYTCTLRECGRGVL